MLTFSLHGGNERFRVSVGTSLGDDGGEADFDFDLSSGARTEHVLRRIRMDQCSVDDLKDIGIQLWSGLETGYGRDAFAELLAGLGETENLQIRLSLPDDLEHLPWESLYDREFGFLAAHPRISLLREVDTRLSRVPRQQRDLPARVLVVIPAGSELLVEQEWDGICRAVEVVKDRIVLERMDGRVTPDALREVVQRGQWDVVHYIGHGELDPARKPRIRLNGENRNAELWLEGEPFSSLFLNTSVRLVVLNCCFAGARHPERTLSGIGRLLREKGVLAVVAMQYEIADHIALRFSREFYRQLFTGDLVGCVDRAMTWARGAIFLNMTEETCRGFITPVVYAAEQAPRLFRGPLRDAPTVLVSPGSGATVDLPESLVEDIRQGNCVFVLGPEILHTDQSRGEVAPPGPGALARRVADASTEPYPEPRDFELCESAGLWMKRQLLQWVCQHFMAVESQGPLELARSIRAAYDAQRPTSLMRRLSSWEVPGIICTHFDALQEEALRQRNKGVVVASSLSTELASERSDHPMVAYLRGTIHDPNSLVLTEEDHHALYESLSAMSPVIVDLVRGRFGRSILILGETPRDFLLQRLAMQLVDPKLRTQGPCYFLRSSRRERNDPAWSHLKVRWID
ncbi:MAG TPA: CHAT domain-containing protein, partial [Candidatus Krumholzibacteria bacterium]